MTRYSGTRKGIGALGTPRGCREPLWGVRGIGVSGMFWG